MEPAWYFVNANNSLPLTFRNVLLVIRSHDTEHYTCSSNAYKQTKFVKYLGKVNNTYNYELIKS